MSIEDEITRSRELVYRFWSVVAERCPDRRLRGSRLEPVEGLQGHRSLDLDRRYHIDHFAVAGGSWTPLSTRFQDARFAAHSTITLRQTEIRHLLHMGLDEATLGAALHVQMYGTDDALELVIIAEVRPIVDYYHELDDKIWWLHAPDGTPFAYMTCGSLQAINALVWKCVPGEPEQMGLFS